LAFKAESRLLKRVQRWMKFAEMEPSLGRQRRGGRSGE
jgi:hypothetical protein